MTHLGKSHRTSSGKKFLAIAAMTLVAAFGLAGRAYADEPPTPTLTAQANYNAETFTVTVANTTETVVYWIIDANASAPDFVPPSTDPETGEETSSNYNEATISEGVAVIDVAGVPDGSYLHLRLDLEPDDVTLYRQIQRYAVPNITKVASQFKFTVALPAAGEGVVVGTGILWSKASSTAAPAALTLNNQGAFTYDNGTDGEGTNRTGTAFEYYTTYSFRAYKETSPDRFPSEAVKINTSRYHLPAIVNFSPLSTSGNMATATTGNVVSDSPKIYLNHSNYIVDNDATSGLKTPMPGASGTYDQELDLDNGTHQTQTIQVGRSEFLLTAAAPASADNAAATLFPSTTQRIDTFYCNRVVFHHKTGDGDNTTPHYLGLGPNGNVKDFTVFNDSCLWERDAWENTLYQERNYVRYYLYMEGNGMVMAASASNKTFFALTGSAVMNADNRAHTLCFAGGANPWKWTTEVTQSTITQVHYLAQHETSNQGSRQVIEHISVEKLEVTGDATAHSASYKPNWLALEQGASWHLVARPHVSIGIHTLPPHEHYFFDCQSQRNMFILYNGHSYSDEDLLPNQHTVSNINDPTEDSLSFTWNITPETAGGDASIFTTQTSEANHHQADIARAQSSVVEKPMEFALTVTMRYRDANFGFDTTATSDAVVLIAEQKVDVLRPVPNTRTQQAGAASVFHPGRHYLMRNEHIVGTDTAHLSASVSQGHAARTTTKATAERVFYVDSVHIHDSAFYTFEDPALNTEDLSHQHLFLTWSGHDMYCMRHPNASFEPGDGPDERTIKPRQLFYLQPFADGEGHTYFTLRPRDAEDVHRSLMPARALTTEDTVLRIAPSARSHFRFTTNENHDDVRSEESPKEYFYASRWELEDPRLLPPTITMDYTGKVTITDSVGELRGVLGTLKWQVKRHDAANWPDTLTGTDTLTDLHHAVTIDDLLLAEGDSIRAWKEAPLSANWFDDSPKTRFGAERSSKPDINVVGRNNTVTITAKADETIYWFSGSASDSPTYQNRPGPSVSFTLPTSKTVHAYTRAANKLESAMADSVFVPQLAVVIDESRTNDSKVYLKAVVRYTNDQGQSATTPAAAGSWIIKYTDNNDNPLGKKPSGAPPDTMTYNDATGIPYTGFVMIKAYADTAVGHRGEYRQSELFTHLFKGNYYTFCFLENDQHGTQGYVPDPDDNNFLLVNRANYDSLINSTSLSSYHPAYNHYQNDGDRNVAWTGKTFQWMGATVPTGQTTVETPIRNVETGSYLNLTIENETPKLHVGLTQQLWTWSGEWSGRQDTFSTVNPVQARINAAAGKYMLKTRVNGTWYYLAFHTTKKAWMAVTGAGDSCALQVAFRTFNYDYRGGKEFQPLGDSLYIMPEDATKWQAVAGRGQRAWAALSTDQTVKFRIGLMGKNITYHDNMDINIVRPEWSVGRDTNTDGIVDEIDPDYFVPWQQWHRYAVIRNGVETGDSAFCHYYTEVDGFDTVRTYAHVDNLTHIDWQYDGTDDGVDNPTSLTTYDTWTNLGSGSNVLFQYYIDSHKKDTLHLRRTSTEPHAGLTNEGEPDFSTLLQVHITYDNAYANGFTYNEPGKLHLFAERANNLRPFNADGERTRFVSCSYMGNSDVRHYLAIDTTKTVTGEEVDDHDYLNGQPVVETSTEYTQFAAWMVRTASPGTYTIRPIHWLDRILCHRPGNKYEHGTSTPNGLYLYDPASVEARNWIIRKQLPAGPFALPDSVYERFAIYTFGPNAKEYVVISPYRAGKNNGQTINLADHIGLANHDGEHRWMNAFFGSENVEDLEEAAIAAKCQEDFWSTRWEEEHAWLTPPDITMDPSGNVTLKHRLEDAPYPTGQVDPWRTKLKYYWKIGSAPTFENTVADAGGLAPGTGFSAAEGTTEYDPNNPPTTLPKLTKDQTLYAVAVLTDNCTTDHFYYKKHISKPHTFTARKCPAPVVPEDLVNGSITSAAGDSIVAAVMGGGMTDPHWDNHAPHCVHAAGSISLRSLGYMQGDNVEARAYRHNWLESDSCVIYHGWRLTMEMTAVDKTDTTAVVSFRVRDNSPTHQPNTSHYEVWYTKDGSDPSDPNSTRAKAEEAGAPNTFKTDSLFFDGASHNQPITVKAIAMAPPGPEYYKSSQILERRIVPSTFPGTNLAREGRTGKKDKPYFIETPDDLLTVAKKVNADSTPATGCAAYDTAWYKVTADINMDAIDFPGIGSLDDGHPFKGHWDGGYDTVKGRYHVVSHLEKALFDSCVDAHIYNVIIDSSQIVRNDGTKKPLGALVCVARGNTRIYNCGVLSSDKSKTTTVTNEATSRTVGGLVGYISDGTRVVNSYNFATVKGSATADTCRPAGVVGRIDPNKKSNRINSSSKYDIRCAVVGCANYGIVQTEGTKVYPVVGQPASVVKNNFFPHNFYYAEAGYDLTKLLDDGSFGSDKGLMNRFEIIRYLLNTNRRRCGWWVNANVVTNSSSTATGSYSDLVSVDNSHIGTWVLDTNIAPFPVVKPKYDKNGHVMKYPSIINPDYEADWRDTAAPYRGRRLTEWWCADNTPAHKGRLKVTIKSTEHSIHDEKTNAATSSVEKWISITDMDTLAYDWNYGKIQLPYYQDVFAESKISSDNYIVTGWKITHVMKGTDTTTDGVCPADYNFADRYDVKKDIYHSDNNKRVFAQGGFYNVPDSVTAITIEAYWGKAYYVCEQRNDTYFTGSSDNKWNGIYGSPSAKAYTVARDTSNTPTRAITNKSMKDDGEGNSVYDRAIVLVSDCHIWSSGATYLTGGNDVPFTMTTIDEDYDNEPDYAFYHYFNGRQAVNPIRFDFLPYADYSMAGKIDDTTYHMGITRPMGHYEITETAMAQFYQFEYDRGAAVNNGKKKEPLILNGGLFWTIASSQNNYGKDNAGTISDAIILAAQTPIDRTLYILMGGHVYQNNFSTSANPNSGKHRPARRCPVTVTGGEYKEFYLSGYQFAVNNPWDDDAWLYARGGYFRKYCSGGMEEIKGDIIVKVDHILANEFYSGGLNPDPTYRHQGSIDVTIDNSWVKGTFTAGPKFGVMEDNTTVTAHATNTRFSEYYGAGLGGTGLTRYSKDDASTSNNNLYANYNGYGDSKYKRGMKVNGNNVDIDYAFEFLPWSDSKKHVKRFYVYAASLSKATVNKTRSTLKGCTIDGNYYGGGYVGQVTDSAISVLEDCTVKGNIFGGGNSSQIPSAVVYEWLGTTAADKAKYPKFVGGVYIDVDKNTVPNVVKDTFYWANTRPNTISRWGAAGSEPGSSGSYLKTTEKLIYTSEDLNDLGQCEATHLTVRNCTVGSMKGEDIDTTTGSIYGGGNEAEMKVLGGSGTCTTYVAVQGTSHVLRDVFGAGKEGTVHGGTTVEIGKDKESGATYRPWIEGDVYGGGDLADAEGNTNVTLYEGITGPVYGGGNQGSVIGNAKVTVKGGYIGYQPKDGDRDNLEPIVNEVGRDKMYYGIFGGGYGYGTVVSGKDTVQVGADSMNADVKVYGSVYGGGEAGQVGGGYRTSTFASATHQYNPTDNIIEQKTGNAVVAGRQYYTFLAPSWPANATTYTTVVSIVPDTNGKTIDIAGAVFGGGRGYYVTTIESNGTIKGTEYAATQPHAGAVYGNTKVTVGGSKGDTARLHIGSFDYYMDQQTGWKYSLLERGMLTNQGVFWQQDLSVFDYDVQRYIPLKLKGLVDEHKVQTIGNGWKTIDINNPEYDPEVQYFLKMGRVTVAGGGERGAVYGSKCFDANNNLLSDTAHFGADMTGGNSTVELLSGTMGDYADYEVEGCVYGAGLSADIDGTSTVTVDGKNVWVRGDVYAGGCMGHVYAYRRADSNATTTATQMALKKGWVRNAFGGSNLADHGKGCNSTLTVGEQGANDTLLLVSESVYGGNGFSPSRGIASVTVHSGMIGYVHPNVTINAVDTAKKKDDAIRSEDHTPVIGTIYLNNQDNLAYEGNVYGGGFGPEAFVEGTTVTVKGGKMRNGVFGGGELAAVRKPKGSANTTERQYTHRLVDDVKPDSVTSYGYAAADTLTYVTVEGGEMAMVLGGGRGYTNFVRTKNRYTGTVMGNTRVKLTGGTVRPTTGAIVRDLGGGNVYGGGLEGEVTGNTVVTVSGGTVEGSVFGGGRGYRYAMTGPNAVTTENITDRASRDAGAVYGDTRVTVTGGAVESGVYGGGEGLNYASNVGGLTYYDTVATVHGNATVQLSGGTIGLGHTHGGAKERGSYAGGRIASVRGWATMTVSGNADVATVFGGNDICGKVMGGATRTARTGNDQGGMNDGTQQALGTGTETYVLVTGNPQIGRLFGGGNGGYDYYANFDMQEYLHLSMPVQQSTYVDINIGSSGYIGAAFGGGNEAPVDTAQVALQGQGLVDSLYGGGNNATVNTKATVMARATVRETGNNVNQLFGGNNQATMYILPDIELKSGVFGRVFGGGNAGAMEGLANREDRFGNPVKALSTYVLVNSDQVTVTNGLYGGCNHAAVSGGTYVDVRKTSSGGIAKLFGGNDISNYVREARLDVSGGLVKEIFGGGNGYYDYTEFNGRYNAFDKGHGGDVNHYVAIFVDSVPITGSTLVNVWGGTIKSAIYGGGYAGHCSSTHVVINDKEGIEEDDEETEETEEPAGAKGPRKEDPTRETATIEGNIYGGGCGYESLIYSGADVDKHVGNVTGSAVTDLYHVTEMTGNKVYGGGMAGNVGNTLLTVHPTWEKPLDTLYGGCWGGDVKGTARVVMNCAALAGDAFNVTALYGGNDFSGNVHRSVLTVNGGRYQNIYGAGNGDYGPNRSLKYPNGTVYNKKDTLKADVPVPNSEFPVINFNDGLVTQNMYGGGNVGSCFVKGKDTLTTVGAAHTNLEDYALVQVNVHGGTFRNNIFAGASGEKAAKESRPLIHGLKVLNMDNGLVYQSVYGGTKSLDDGYKNECSSNNRDEDGALDETTLRPSSVLNLVGGRVKNNVYGGGYLGNIYGSVYVNIGKQAVLDSRMYNTTYAGHDYAVADYMPTFITDETADTGSNLMARELKLDRSVYNGANWGDADNGYIFNTPGFYGGESRIRVDGIGYNTKSSDDGNSDPEMNINYSLIGAGTSCEGGDVYRLIEVLNYGDWEGCDVSKELWSVQRADKAIFRNVGLALTGDQDAYTAYASTPYTLNRCDTILFVGENILRIEEPVVKAHVLEFRGTDSILVDNPVDANTDTLVRNDKLKTMSDYASTDCSTDCQKVTAVMDHGYTSLLVNNGAYIDVFYQDTTAQGVDTIIYGEVKGYAFLRAEDQTQAVVTARYKLTAKEAATPAEAVNEKDGGFFSMCEAENESIYAASDPGHGVNGGRIDAAGDTIFEYQYGNYTTEYRAWKMGQGKRLRHITITAHSDLTELPAQNRYVVAPMQTGTATLAVAKGILELPPTKSGNYYRISGGIDVDRENNEMKLIQGALLPGTYDNANHATYNKWDDAVLNSTPGPDSGSYTLGRDASNNLQSQWLTYDGSAPDWRDISLLMSKPNDHFGMLITAEDPLTGGVYGVANADNTAAIYSNSYFTGTYGYCTKSVQTTSNNVMPKLEVYLTYNPNLTTTLMGDVEFTLYEYEPGNPNPVGSIDVIISITTVVKNLQSQKVTLVAMHNEFDNHEYVRKVVLPASLVRRNIYLTSIEWEPAVHHQDTCKNCNGTETGGTAPGTPGNFFLQAYGNGTPPKSPATFALKVSPTESLSSSLTTTLGWSEIDPNAKDLDLFTAAGKTGDSLAYSAKEGEALNTGYRAVNLKGEFGNDARGKFIGILDGRSAAGLEATLLFNGNLVYDDLQKGRAILHFDYYNQNTVGLDDIGNERSGWFVVTLNVETREKGDTIYLASADTLKRTFSFGDIILKAYSTDNANNPDAYDDNKKGLEPIQYFQTFAQAMSIYHPGDVICILDTVIISGIENDVVHGSEYNFVPVVRYSGNHWQFPTDTCAYRGPMISLRQNGRLTAEYMRFDGSLVSKRKLFYNSRQTKPVGTYKDETALPFRYYPTTINPENPATLTGHYTYSDTGWVKDTVAVIGPIFEVRDGAELTLSHNTKVQNNWNRSTDPDSLGGAIRIANYRTNALDSSSWGCYKVRYKYSTRAHDGRDSTVNYVSPYWIVPNPKVVLNNSVEIKNIFTDADMTGAVHVEDGVLQLGVANEGTAISIQDNYHTGSGTFWKDHPQDHGRFTVDTSVVKNFKKANVYLAHEHASGNWPDTCLNDAKSCVVTFDNELSPDTRIGISKRFPGEAFSETTEAKETVTVNHPAVRDTIQIAKVTGTHQQYVRTAYRNGNFFNDRRLYSYADVDTFYHEALSTHTLYLQRCATFQKQMFAASNAAYDELPVLQYLMNTYAACPNGTDEAVFSVHGGCYPYTYKWVLGESDTIRRYTTPYPHDKVKADIDAAGDRLKAKASNSDTSLLAGMSFDNGNSFTYTAIATDLFGCQQKKSFTVNIDRVNMDVTPRPTSYDTLKLIDPANTTTHKYDWKDTSTRVETATRKYKEVHFVTKVHQLPGWGQVLSTLGSTSGSEVTSTTPLCPGDAVYLQASGLNKHRFIQWDFDPYDDSTTVFVMPNSGGSITVNAYFGPQDYWKDVVTCQEGGQSVDTNDIKIGYYGDVHVKTNKGLAWLISLCNGLNGVQARTFFNDTIYLATGTYDMSAHLWTPLGTDQHPFRGVLMPESGATPVISGIIVNEPDMSHVGFFGYLDSATVQGIEIRKSHFVGQQYVGALAGEVRSASTISGVKVADADTNATTSHGTPESIDVANLTLITANYASGGIAGTMSGLSTITGCEARAKYMGATIYNGGVVGYGHNVNISNTSVRALPRMSSLYSGGVVGNADGKFDPDAKSRSGSQIVNNYVHYYNPDGKASRAGGLVGRARNTYIANNYVYGENTGATLSGALGSVMENGVRVENCFFEQGFDNRAFGYNSAMDTTAVTSFHGTGRAVILTDTLGNNSSLTRQLNRWVYAHGDTTLHYWHSDTVGVNNGYPLFGEPEYEPVNVTREVATCDSYRDYTTSGTYYYHVVDSAEFMDTTVTLLLTLNYSELTEFIDSVRHGEGYEGHGFYLTPKEIEMMRQTLQEEGAVTVVVSDTLQTAAGCDSIVTLYLTVGSRLTTPNSQLLTLKVYPNPTTKLVTVEADGLQQVELYDAVSRRLATLTANRSTAVKVDLDGLPAGAYYLRIRTENGTVIKKVIKR